MNQPKREATGEEAKYCNDVIHPYSSFKHTMYYLKQLLRPFENFCSETIFEIHQLKMWSDAILNYITPLMSD